MVVEQNFDKTTREFIALPYSGLGATGNPVVLTLNKQLWKTLLKANSVSGLFI
ncbi:hypothetical protein Phep_1082 [Pedobacter heparinus DSM 2366]|uniref:Uncharacterized protein n=1 Tax=Pedobacter heparinus (strain ATCC 13125 / DSM 2366 / CIP 104194 / JCM 7457 / NBRC 12017 / NCIMB 9290 / NRRL B-14731 / HIM 762-3) TaxID=485917 RepID=C6Y3M1_PEDHD|nr:hypothetical protein Phep_1082 [Pedobacter heparinus DSM 2366]